MNMILLVECLFLYIRYKFNLFKEIKPAKLPITLRNALKNSFVYEMFGEKT